MSKKIFLAALFALLGSGSLFAQSDSTDLTLYMEDITLETSLDSILYGGGDFQELNLDFTISDTVAFSKVYVELKEVVTNSLVFKHTYDKEELDENSLIDPTWLVNIPFGNLSNLESYTVCILIENYAGALGSTITKTINP